MVQVAQGFDVADHVILERMEAGDLVVTQDVPLAAGWSIVVGWPLIREAWYDKESVKSYLRRRNEREAMREAGLIQGGPAPFLQKIPSSLREFLISFSRD